MRFTKRNLIKTAAVSSAILGAIAVAAPASANSFGPTDYATGGYTKVSYDDANDQFCVTGTGTDYAGVTVAPSNGRRGPRYYIYFSRPRGNKVRQPSTSLRGHSLLLSGRRSSDWKHLRPSPLLQLT